MPCITLLDFIAAAGDGHYAEGDFDDAGLQRNVEAHNCEFRQLRGAEYEGAVREISDDGALAMFNGSQLGCVLHMPCPRHWVALVAPEHVTRESAALLCDSLYSHVFALTVDEVVDLFLAMGVRHMQAGEAPVPEHV